jgi:hypothetical protein
LIIIGALVAGACGSDTGDESETTAASSTAPTTTSAEQPTTTSAEQPTTSPSTAPTTTSAEQPTTTSAAPIAAGENLGAACRYTNPFSGADECRRYTGDAWTDASRAEDCAAPFSNTEGELVDDGCDLSGSIGTCRVAGGGGDETLTYFYGGGAEMLAAFCANPGGGVWADAGE